MSAWFANPFVNWFAISNIKSAHINIATSLSQQIIQLNYKLNISIFEMKSITSFESLSSNKHLGTTKVNVIFFL